MDRMIYTTMTGANAAMQRQAILSNNLANATTTGFRAELTTFARYRWKVRLRHPGVWAGCHLGLFRRTGHGHYHRQAHRCHGPGAMPGLPCRVWMAWRPTRATALWK